MIDLSEAKHILVVKLSSLGDIIHALPAVNALRKKYPHIQIDWLVNQAGCMLLQSHSAVDNVIVVDFNHKSLWNRLFILKKLLGKLRSVRYDAIFDLQGLLKSSIITYLSRAPLRIGFNWRSLRHEKYVSLFYNHCIDSSTAVHIVDKNLCFALAAGADSTQGNFNIGISERDRNEISKFISAVDIANRKIVVIHPGSRWKSKRWPLSHYAQLIEIVGQRNPESAIVIVEGPEEEDLIEELRELTNCKIFYPGLISLGKLAALLQYAKVMVGSDSGPLHLAAAMGTRVVGLYGPTKPERNGPYGNGHFIIRADLECLGCRKRYCNELDCMREISPTEVADKVTKILSVSDKGVVPLRVKIG